MQVSPGALFIKLKLPKILNAWKNGAAISWEDFHKISEIDEFPKCWTFEQKILVFREEYQMEHISLVRNERKFTIPSKVSSFLEILENAGIFHWMESALDLIPPLIYKLSPKKFIQLNWTDRLKNAGRRSSKIWTLEKSLFETILLNLPLGHSDCYLQSKVTTNLDQLQ